MATMTISPLEMVAVENSMLSGRPHEVLSDGEWQCSECNQIFTDEDGPDSVVLQQLGVCSEKCGLQAVLQLQRSKS